ncbi:MAG: hypothetical protein ACI90V_000961 [Bacillariaceae sp.]|jgi:hypothetical protein
MTFMNADFFYNLDQPETSQVNFEATINIPVTIYSDVRILSSVNLALEFQFNLLLQNDHYVNIISIQ